MQMYPPVLAVEFEGNVVPLVSESKLSDEEPMKTDLTDGAIADDTAESLTDVEKVLSDGQQLDSAEERQSELNSSALQGLTLSLMRQKALDPYVITNDADPNDRHVMTTFSQLQDKITELAANNKAYTLTLNQDLVVTGDTSLTFPGLSTWTVEGNGKTVKKEVGAPVNLNRVIMIGKNSLPSTITLKNVVIDGANTYRTCSIEDGSTLILDSGAIIQNGYSASGATTGGIHMWNNTTLHMKPGSKILGNISETSSYYGGAIRMVRNCVVDIDGAVISGNRASNSGGAIHAPHEATSITVKNTTFSGNIAYSDAYQGHGGAIHSAVLTIIDNCKFENNIAKNGAGAIFMAPAQVSDNEELIVKDSTFSGNNAQYGGAISSQLKTSITGGTFSGNIATSHGGAINLTNRSGASLIAEKTTFTQNKAIMGGAIFTQNTTTIKNNTSFIKNEATREGGAIYTSSLSYADPADNSKYANLTIDNTTIFENNKVSYSYEPPSNYADFTNLLFSKTSFTNQLNPYSGQAVLSNDSLLNNNDINYKNSYNNTLSPVSYVFEDADAGTLPQAVMDLLPTASQAEIGSIVIPTSPISNAVKIANGGTWKFIGWNKSQINIPQEGVAFVGTWKEFFSVTYVGGTNAIGVPVDNNQYPSGATVTILDAPTREGYKFLGWRMNSLLQPGDVITVANADIVLAAEWKKVGAGTPSRTISSVTTDVPERGEGEPINATSDGANEPPSISEPGGTDSLDDAGPRDWAFTNLMMTLCTILFAAILGFAKRKKEKDDTVKVRHRRYFAFGVIIAVIAVVIFLFTQDMTKPMVMTDNWTITMAVALVAQALMVYLGLKWRDVK